MHKFTSVRHSMPAVTLIAVPTVSAQLYDPVPKVLSQKWTFSEIKHPQRITTEENLYEYD